MAKIPGALAASLAALLGAAACSGGDPAPPVVCGSTSSTSLAGCGAPVRIGYLHHSTGGNVWGGGVPGAISSWNAAHGSDYRITSVTYPDTGGGYPWANYPYDYWNLWVSHTGTSRDRNELNLDNLAAAYDVIVFKHCFPVSAIGPDSGASDVASSAKTIGNYQAQYNALKARMRQFPSKRFIVWTGAALTAAQTDAASAARARQFFTWVKNTWDEAGDNIFVWDFFELETEGGDFLLPAYASGTDSHPNGTFSNLAGPLVAKRIVDVIEGRGDTGSLTGK